MLQGVLFDLDGTLLDIEIDEFIRVYFNALAPVIAGMLATPDTELAIAALKGGTEAMFLPHPGETNKQAFDARFLEVSGIDLREHAESVDDFYRDVFPTLGGDTRPVPGARETVDAARALGLKTVVATNPMFPRAAILHRMSWAGFSADDFDLVTSYENMPATKPRREYYQAIADAIDIVPQNLLMVGDDPVLDMAAADVGMRTFYVGEFDPPAVTYRGSISDVAGLLPRLMPTD